MSSSFCYAKSVLYGKMTSFSSKSAASDVDGELGKLMPVFNLTSHCETCEQHKMILILIPIPIPILTNHGSSFEPYLYDTSLFTPHVPPLPVDVYG